MIRRPRSGASAVGLCLALLVLHSLGCSCIHGVVPPAPPPISTKTFRAGAARIDITPVPGFPMGGHSFGGEVSRGVWIRLHARAIYLEDDGIGLALVACDLWSIPSALSDRVSEILAGPTFASRLHGRHFGREQIVLAASHTHQSPGLYSSDRFFSMFGAPKAGFDPDLHEVLAHRIASAIATAVDNAEAAELSFVRERVRGLFRNRSIEPFRANLEEEEILAQSGMEACAPTPLYPDPDCCRAVDPHVGVLRIHRTTGDRGLIAAGVFLAVHPTSMDEGLAVYSADLFGALAHELERRFAAAGSEPYVAVFNGAEGDVSPQWTDQSRRDVLALTTAAADPIERMVRQQSEPFTRPIRIAFEPRERLWLSSASTQDGSHLTALLPMPGRATGTGAEDGRFEIAHWISHEGKRGIDIPPHGRKIGQADVIEIGGVTIPPFWPTRLALLPLAPPRSVALGVYRIGRLTLVTLPGEFTTTLGRRIRQRVGAAIGDAEPIDSPGNGVVLLGLAQSYAYYFTTPEEYPLQHYEGSGTFYGTYSGAHIAGRLEELAREITANGTADPHHSERLRFLYLPWFASFLQCDRKASRLDVPPEFVDEGLRDVLTPIDGDAPLAAFPRVCWDEDEHVLDGDAYAAPSTPRTWVEARTSGGWSVVEEDRGLRIVLVAGPGSVPNGKAERWCSYWIAPETADLTLEYRFARQWSPGDTMYAEFKLSH